MIKRNQITAERLAMMFEVSFKYAHCTSKPVLKKYFQPILWNRILIKVQNSLNRLQNWLEILFDKLIQHWFCSTKRTCAWQQAGSPLTNMTIRSTNFRFRPFPIGKRKLKIEIHVFEEIGKRKLKFIFRTNRKTKIGN